MKIWFVSRSSDSRFGRTYGRHAENGAGLRRQRENAFDLAITDILMPEQDGIETVRALKAEFPKLPIIAVSGGGRWSI